MKDTSKILHFINAVALIKLPHHHDDKGDLVVMEGLSEIPFSIERVFVVSAPTNEIRGQHAHKACTQFLTCPSGSIEVLCDDGVGTRTYILNRPNHGLLIPPSIWAQETYQSPGSILTVLCDRPYEAHDYIRNYDEFKIYRQTDDLVSIKQEK